MNRHSGGSFFEGRVPLLLAHRGSVRDGVIENTAPAFALAIADGADILETDVQASIDGAAVIMHDPIHIGFDGSRNVVSELTVAQLRERSGLGDDLLTFEDALTLFPEARFNVDIKAAEAASDLARSINHARAWDRVLVTSFSMRRRLLVTRRLRVQGPTSAGSIEVAMLLVATLCRMHGVMALMARRISAVQVPERLGFVRIVNVRFVRMLRNVGVHTHVWTVNETESARRIHNLGVSGIVTDNVPLLLSQLRRDSSSQLR